MATRGCQTWQRPPLSPPLSRTPLITRAAPPRARRLPASARLLIVRFPSAGVVAVTWSRGLTSLNFRALAKRRCQLAGGRSARCAFSGEIWTAMSEECLWNVFAYDFFFQEFFQTIRFWKLTIQFSYCIFLTFDLRGIKLCWNIHDK